MHRDSRHRAALAVLSVAMFAVAACDPKPAPSQTAVVAVPSPASSEALPNGPTDGPAVSPTPPIAIPASFPLAVVTGMKNVKAVVTLDELTKLGADQKLIVPCGVQVTAPPLEPPVDCTPADAIGLAVQAAPRQIALLPPGLV